MTGLYIHIPFCRKKCFYCSFMTVTNQNHHADEYARCLAQEMRMYEGAQIQSVYFGGGTPSFLSEACFLFLANAVKKNFSMARDAEFTVEMNPEDVTDQKLCCYRDAGVTRLSLGVQTFDEARLKRLGRGHSVFQAKEASHMMRRHGFRHVNIDLMYGFPGQTRDDIKKDLAVLKETACDHVSIYGLTVEEGSRFFVDRVTASQGDEAARQYVFICEELRRLGFDQYEVSNFARPGRRSIHNMNYWKGGNYIGMGTAAHSHQDGLRYWNVSRLRLYIEKIQKEGSARAGEERLTSQQRLGEALVFGLRMLDGVSLAQIEKQTGGCLSDHQKEAIQRLVKEGYLMQDNDALRVSSKGLLVLDELTPYLL